MRFFSTLCCSTTLALGTAQALSHFERLSAFRDRSRLPTGPHFDSTFSTNTKSQAEQTSVFANSKSSKFAVNGTNFPLADFDIGESYAGLLPISDNPNESRELFFWFFPSTNPSAKEEIAIWLQGGPGASSLFGFLTENGPFLWQPGTYRPTPNPYSWTNLTNMVWIEQPVGVGYTKGDPNIKNEYELAVQFAGFWKNFVETFGMQNYKIYLTGESYAGFYVPYIANNFIEANDKTYYDVAGLLINDPTIGDSFLQFEFPAVPYMNYWSNLFGLNETFMNQMNSLYQQCGYTDYMEKYFTFPAPTEHFAPLFTSNFPPNCDVQGAITNAEYEINPCFNIEYVAGMCPITYSPVGPVFSNFEPPGAHVYFNRKDVKAALHAPLDAHWSLEALRSVFIGSEKNASVGYRDDTLPAAVTGVLQNVIEKTNNTMIGNGDLDFQIAANGTLFVLQNLTWNGGQGFSKYPTNTLFVPYHVETNPQVMTGAGAFGNWITERGLTFYTVNLAGHEIPQFQPGAAYRVLEKLLGRVPSLGYRGPFTT